MGVLTLPCHLKEETKAQSNCKRLFYFPFLIYGFLHFLSSCLASDLFLSLFSSPPPEPRHIGAPGAEDRAFCLWGLCLLPREPRSHHTRLFPDTELPSFHQLQELKELSWRLGSETQNFALATGSLNIRGLLPSCPTPLGQDSLPYLIQPGNKIFGHFVQSQPLSTCACGLQNILVLNLLDTKFGLIDPGFVH